MELFDIVRLPFPYSDFAITKTRPALIISPMLPFNYLAGHAVTLMITSAERSSFPLDVAITRRDGTGLLKDSIVRMKLFTGSQDIILEKIGTLHPDDRPGVVAALGKLLPYL